jgi:nucleoside-triphosphatase
LPAGNYSPFRPEVKNSVAFNFILLSKLATIYYVTGPIQSGKTTRLASWCEGRSEVAGLLSQVIAGERFFRDLQSQDLVPMEAGPTETQVQQVGRFTFSAATFEWANNILLQAADQPGINYLLIDEVGPLELQGKGLAPALEKILPAIPPHLNVVLVIREKLLEEVLRHYNLHRYLLFPFQFPE